MNQKIKLIILILFLTLNFSCAEKKSTEKEINQPELVATSKSDTLKFTSGIRAIFQDSKGNYWFGSQNEGVSLYDGRSFEYFTTNEGLAENQIRSIQEDEYGTIWIGTARGVSSYDDGKLTRYSTEFNAPKSDWNTTTGNLWFYAGEEDGINRFDGMKMHYLIFPKTENMDLNNSFGVTGISRDNEERVWVATYSALFSYDGENVAIYGNRELALEDNEQIHLRSVLADSKGRIWLGNNGIGVMLKNGDSTIHFSKEQGVLLPMEEFTSNIQNGETTKNTGLQAVFAIEEDAEGAIWFGDRDSGAWKFDGKRLTNVIVDTKLKSQMIWDIYLDKNKNLLFGMANGGVYAFNGTSFDKTF